MATLTGELISETYDSLLKVTDNNTITGIKKRITDGFGNDIPLLLSSTDLEIDGTFILSALTELAPASKFLSLKADNSVGFRTSSELLSDIGGVPTSSISGTTGRLSKFTSTGAVGNSILNEIGNAIHLTDGTSSYASFGINNPGVDNDAYIGSTINNDFLIKVNNTEALRIDTALRLNIANIQNALGDTDKFLVSEDGVVKYRTGDELRADIGAGVGSVTSVGLTMPVAFSVANSPITSSGTLAVTAVGTASQYIRGDGQLATLPTGAGGGSAVNYYLNGSIASSVAGYQQMDNSAVIGLGTDFNLTGNGLIAQFLTDLNNPNRLLIPGGAWNLELFFSTNSAGGSEKFYVELLKYNGTTFTSIASGITAPEAITGGTATDLYLTSIAVPETVLLATDRLAIRIHIVDNSGGRTVTLHTEDNTLCQVTTTFAGGISALNGLTANTQYFAVGTSGTDFAISSTLDTHTFNLPTASTTKRGALSASDWNTFNNKQPAGDYVTLDTNQTIAGEKTFTAGNIFIDSRSYFAEDNGQSGQAGYTQMITLADSFSFINGATTKSALFTYGGGIRNYTLPSANGTLSLTSDLIGYLPLAGGTLTGALTLNSGLGSNSNFSSTANGLEIISDGSTASNRNIILKIASSTALSIDNSLNVAIGYTTNPSLYKLDVNGTGRFQGNLFLTPSTGTNSIYTVAYNTAGNIYLAVEGNTAGALITGSSAYAGLIGTDVGTKDLQLFTNKTVRLTITSTGAATFSSTINIKDPALANTQIAKASFFGYSSSYVTTIIGNTNAQTLAFNVDVSANPGGSFSGNGNEYLWRNTGSFKTPNAANTEYNTLFNWNSSGQMTFTGAATFSGMTTINGSGENLRLGTNTSDNYITFRNSSNVQIGDIGYDGRDTNGLSIWNASGSLVFGAGGVRALTIASTGAATFSNTVSAKGFIGYRIDGGVGLEVNGGDLGTGSFIAKFNDYSNNTKVAILGNGNVGIGTTTPSFPLDVETGSGRIQLRTGGATGGTGGGNGIASVNSASNALADLNVRANIITLITDATERMRITSGGNVLIGTTSSGTDFTRIASATGSANCLGLVSTDDANNGGYIFFRNSATSGIGNISRIGTTNAVAYNTTSDKRLKKDLGVANSNIIDSVIIHDFEWIQGKTLDKGVFAQELYKVKPLAVCVGKDDVNEGGELDQPWGVDYSKLIPDLIVYCQNLKKSIQELNEKIIQLENK